MILGLSIASDHSLIYWAIQSQELNLMGTLVNLPTSTHLKDIILITIWLLEKLQETNIYPQNKQLRAWLLLFMIVQWVISTMMHQLSQDIRHMQCLMSHQWNRTSPSQSIACQWLSILQYASNCVQKLYSHCFQNNLQVELLRFSSFWYWLDLFLVLWWYKHASTSASTLFGSFYRLKLKQQFGI